MFQFLYLLWALLPLFFIGLWVWSFLKPWFGVHGKEDKLHHFSQAVFCSVGFGIALLLDQKVLLDSGDEVLFSFIDMRLVRWLLFPAVLVLMAYLQWIMCRKPAKSHSKFTGTAQALR